MKKKIAALAVVMMMMATFSFSVPALATIQNGQQQDETENCWEIFCDLFENIEQKIRKLLGLEESEETDSEDCEGCSFEVESADTKVWLAYMGESGYFQFEVTPVEGGLKNVRIKKLDDLQKSLYEIPNVKQIEIYGVSIYLLTGNNQVMCIDTETKKISIVASDVEQLVWIDMNGNRLAYTSKEGKVNMIDNME